MTRLFPSFKNCALLFLAVILFGAVDAQSYTIQPDTNLLTVSMYSDGYEEKSYKIYNNLGDTLLLEWELISGSAPANMRVSVCDWKTCLSTVGGWPVGRQMEPLPKDTFAPLKLQMNPAGTYGLASACYRVWDINNPSQVDTLCFEADVILGFKNDISDQLNIFPNPAHETLVLESLHGVLSKGSLGLYDLSGKLTRSWDLQSRSQMELSLKGLGAGMYWLRYETEDGRAVKKVLKMN